MNLKTIFGASALAITLPFMASAAPIDYDEVAGLISGSVYNVSSSDLFVYQDLLQPGDGNQTLSFGFFNDTGNQVLLEATTSVNAIDADSQPDALAGFGSPTMMLADSNGSFNEFSAILGTGEEDDTVTFFVKLGTITGKDFDLDIQIKPTAVPVPAAGFLLLGGLGGLAMMRRRKKS